MLEDPQEKVKMMLVKKCLKRDAWRKKENKSECDNIETTCQNKVKDVAEKLPPVENPWVRCKCCLPLPERERITIILKYINLYLHIHLVNFCNTYMISLSPFYVHIYEHMKIKGAKKGIHVGKIDIHNP